jgi:hypothetical protein
MELPHIPHGVLQLQPVKILAVLFITLVVEQHLMMVVVAQELLVLVVVVQHKQTAPQILVAEVVDLEHQVFKALAVLALSSSVTQFN